MSPTTASTHSPGLRPWVGRRPNAALRVTVRLQVRDCDPPARGWLAKGLLRVARIAGAPTGRINVVVVGDDEMARLHERFAGVPGTTDVLTFDLRDGAAAHEALEGDLVLCVDEAARQAFRRGHPVRLELLLYAVHGLNHLLGGDDHSAAGARAMHEREDRWLTAAGLGPVFGRPVRKASRRTGRGQSRSRLKEGS